MKIRLSADHAGWSIREAAWGIEERVLWRGSDATRGALDRASRTLQPLQKLIQTRLTWPLGDAYRARGRATRRVLSGSATAIAIAAAAAGGVIASGQSSQDRPPTALPPASVTPVPLAANAEVLQGVTPQFQSGHAAPPPPTPPSTKPPAPGTPVAPAAPASDVAWQFAQAFVAYEVGHSNKKTDAAFEATATKQLAKALAADPPRLPANGKVPRARVLNVVLASGTKTQVTASVSLVRLRAISELRLTLTRSGANWRVAQVLG